MAVELPKTIRLGDIVKDRVTGLVGTVVARTEFLYGCVRVCVQPAELKDGKPVDPSYFDEPAVDVVVKEEKDLKPPQKGGERDHEQRVNDRPVDHDRK